jgi:phospholipid/cholesterol/gamma-HCH transport system substrate-binding protein
MARSIRRLADNLDKRTQEITAGINRVTGPAVRQYEALAEDGRKTLNDIGRTLRSLEKNPQQLLFGSKPTIPEYSGRP